MQDGDMGGDDPQSLAEQIAEAEKDYYAAKGFHGAHHHNTLALLDTYHKLVRKLVRAVEGGSAPDQGVPEEQDGAEPGADEQGDSAPPDRVSRAVEKPCARTGCARVWPASRTMAREWRSPSAS
jgi:hypothetical protein